MLKNKIDVNNEISYFYPADQIIADILARLDKLESINQSQIGLEKWFNINNKYKNQEIVQLGSKIWGLAGSIVNIADYPTAFANSGAEDLGNGTFRIPQMFDGTIRNIARESQRELGSYEEDDFKGHTHTIAEHSHSVPAHAHGIADIIGNFKVGGSENGGPDNAETHASGGFSLVDEGWGKLLAPTNRQDGRRSFNFSSHRAGVTATNNDGAGNTGSAGAGSTSSTGGTETRMKNTAGQWYLLLKIDI
jgi:hypothetical protein